MKIHIIGCSGTGKTRLATALARTYGIPHHAYGVRTAPEKRAALLEEILKQPDWIVEGCYKTCRRSVKFSTNIPKR